MAVEKKIREAVNRINCLKWHQDCLNVALLETKTKYLSPVKEDLKSTNDNMKKGSMYKQLIIRVCWK